MGSTRAHGESIAERDYNVAPGKSITLAWRSASTKEPFALATPPSQRQPDTAEKSGNKRPLSQLALKTNKKTRRTQATVSSATEQTSGRASAVLGGVPPPPQLPALEPRAPPNQPVVETS